MSSVTLTWTETLAYREAYASETGYAFYRDVRRRTTRKRPCDCGHVIDGSEPYRYAVWLLRGARELIQRTDCEFCARQDARF